MADVSHTDITRALATLGERAGGAEVATALENEWEPFEVQMRRRMQTRTPDHRSAYLCLARAGAEKVRRHLELADALPRRQDAGRRPGAVIKLRERGGRRRPRRRAGHEEGEPVPPAGAEACGRLTLAHLAERFALRRGNWEVDCPDMVGRVLAMASGSAPLVGRFAAVAADSHYTFIEVARTEAAARARLADWVVDDEYPKRPLALADLHRGSLYQVKVTVRRDPSQSDEEEGVRSCQD